MPPIKAYKRVIHIPIRSAVDKSIWKILEKIIPTPFSWAEIYINDTKTTISIAVIFNNLELNLFSKKSGIDKHSIFFK